MSTSFEQLIKSGVLAIGDGYRAKNDELGGDGAIFLRSAYLQDHGWVLEEPDRFKTLSTEQFRQKVARLHDTVITTKGNSLGRIGIATARVTGAVYSPHLSYWRSLDPKAIDPKWLYYWSQSAQCRSQIAAAAYSTDMAPYLSLRDQLRIEIALPSITEQSAAACLLGSLDDKIELNRRMALTLEETMRALFRSWFIDFDPVRARMEGRDPTLPAAAADLFPARFNDDGLPEGWSWESLYRFSNVIYGAPFASNRFNTQGIGLPLIRVRDLGAHDPSIFTDEAHPKSHEIWPGDIVVGMDGEFRCHVWKGPRAYLNQRVCHFESVPGIPASYVALALQEPLARFEAGAVGTTVIHLGKKDLDRVQFIQPGSGILSLFDDVCGPLIDRSVAAARENRTLTALRDTLLPKLISGDLRIPEAEVVVEEAA